jgi:DNA polymerase III epsilon subunit family exonuclease
MSASFACQSQNAGLPAGNSRLADLTFVAFDVETTGLSPIACRLVELSGIKFNLASGQIGTFSELINPCQPIPPEVSALHGITDEMVAAAPVAGVVLDSFLQWLGGEAVVLMAHNANFDVEFVKVEATRSGLEHPRNFVIDTLSLAQCLVNDCANYKLKTLAEHFGFGGSLYHRALDDSAYVEKLFRKLHEISGHATLDEMMSTGAISPFGVCPQVNGRDRLSPAGLVRLAVLEEAVAGGIHVRITYQSEFKSTRVVLPKSVIESRGSVYLHAFCMKTQSERTFRVDRIVEAIVENVAGTNSGRDPGRC